MKYTNPLLETIAEYLAKGRALRLSGKIAEARQYETAAENQLFEILPIHEADDLMTEWEGSLAEHPSEVWPC